MKLIDGLRIANQPVSADARPFSVFLACGFTPLHFQTLLKAHLQLALLPARTAAIRIGQYGSLIETLQTLAGESADQAVVIVEWPDIDPRLGLRHLGGWTSDALVDILATAERRLRHMLDVLRTFRVPIALALPSLTPPPVAYTTTIEASRFDLQLQKLVSDFGAMLPDSAVVLKAAELDRISPPAERHDVSAELQTGLPYSLGHADALAMLLSRIVVPAPAKKGLITDLDDTLWQGILGEDGVGGISWDLDHHSQMHGAYQQLLRSLSEAGVLLAVASKNDGALVDEAFKRRDLRVRGTDFYPIEAHWQPKSLSVARILEQWNVGPHSVVFIDDSAMELDEVKGVHPLIECIRFSQDDPAAIYALIHRLRDLFGKRQIRDEDRLRAASIRNTQLNRANATGRESLCTFLEDAQPHITFSYDKRPLAPRILELINKTNQFNLNGKRYFEQEWQTYADAADTVILLVEYEDKYGPLGKIAALTGRLEHKTLVVESWVMSCRAFSRRIEHQTVRELFEHFDMDEIVFGFAATERNQPIADFLQSMRAMRLPGKPPAIARQTFQELFPNPGVCNL